jgi:hypoxanthine phosphoribosyltransferase
MKILYGRETIQDAVYKMGSQISLDYKDKNPLLICVLKGAFMFMTDLIKAIDIDCEAEFVQMASYKGTVQSDKVLFLKDVTTGLRDRHIILVDGIIDSGKSLNFLINCFNERQPASISVAVLCDKECKRKIPVPITYRGFIAEDKFIIGYGMDYNERYRNLPYIVELMK